MARQFDPDKIIDYGMDYYAVLGLKRGCLPAGATRQEREEISTVLETAYRHKAFECHPDGGGSAEKFKLLMRAQRILEDPLLRRIYESGGTERVMMAEDGSPFQVDWDKIGTFREGTRAHSVGAEMFLHICQRAEELSIVPAFIPQTQEDNYEWDWAIPDKEAKLALSIVYDEGDVLRLTGGDLATIEKSLPFKIYLCVPRSSLQFLRGQTETVTYEDGSVDEYTLRGKLHAAAYSDFEFLETTSLDEARAYIGPDGSLAADLAAFRDGSMANKQFRRDMASGQQVWVDSDRMKQMDVEMLRAILRVKTFQVVRDENAADFLKTIPDAPKKRKVAR